jgi:DNA-binding transcriptional ArsR family regulator
MDKNESLLWDVRAYVRIMAAMALRPIAGRVLDAYEKAVLYSKLDGNTAQLRLQEITGVPQPTISVWLSKFTEAGIVAPPDEAYRSYRALFTLQELGINVGLLRKKRAVSEGVSEPEAVEAASPEAA